MKTINSLLANCAAALAMTVLAPLAHANLVANSGFESGDNAVCAALVPVPATCTPSASASLGNWEASQGFGAASAGFAKSGGFSAQLDYSVFGDDAGGSTPRQTISQILTLTPGASYNVSYWLNYLLIGDFAAKVGDSNVFPGTGNHSEGPVAGEGASPGWFLFESMFTALADAETLEFSVLSTTIGRDPATGEDLCPPIDRGTCNIFIDDVSVTLRQTQNDVPEPGTLLLVGVALAAGAAMRRKVRG